MEIKSYKENKLKLKQKGKKLKSNLVFQLHPISCGPSNYLARQTCQTM